LISDFYIYRKGDFMVTNNVIGIDIKRRLQDITDIKEESGESVKRSLEAKSNADESVHRSDITKKQLDEALKEGDQVVEVQTLRVDPVTGDIYPTAPDRFEANQRDLTQQLSDIAIDVSRYCGDLNVSVDNTQGILNAISAVKNTKQKKLVFSGGVYAYSSHLLIDNLDKITIELSPDAKLYDLGKDVQTDQGLKKAPVGLKILNCKEVNIHNINHDSAVTFETRVVTTISDRVPHIDIDKAEIVVINGGLLEGYTGLRIGSVEVYTDTNIMSDYYLRIRKTNKVNVIGVDLASDSANGEVFGFYDCESVEWESCSHIQIGSERTFWSFGKVIQCGDVKIGNHNIKSSSPGSLIDVIATRTLFYSMDVDYINGKFADISNEWNQFTMEQEEAVFKDCFSNGFGVQATFSGDASYDKKIKHLTIDNCMFGKNLAQGRLMSLTMFENVDIKNCDIENIRYLIDARLTAGSADFKRNIRVRRCDFKQTYTPVYMNTIGILGEAKISDTNFEFTGSASLEIVDAKLRMNSETDLAKVTDPSTVIFENCNFEGVKFQISCNTKFVNCEFGHVLSSTYTQFNVTNNATVTVVNSEGHKYSIPTESYFPRGVFIRSTDSNERGAPSSKYVVIGWQRLTNGSGHALNTDWREMRALTGN